MQTVKGYYWEIKLDPSGVEFLVLGYQHETDLARNLEAWIVPSCGSNLCRFSVGEQNIIDFDKELLFTGDYTGTPVLYPTPNRVRNGVFVYQGTIYNQVKRGEPIFAHGLVHNETWNHSEPVVQEQCVKLKTWLEFTPDSDLFAAFPFHHRLELLFTLSDRRIEIAHTIVNLGEQEIPFGLAFHPYFNKLSGEDQTYVSIPAQTVMDNTADLLPTGHLSEVVGTLYDLHYPITIGSLDLDHVFTDIPAGQFAHIAYRTLSMGVTLETDPSFSHLVVYSPRGKAHFCVENQTCSTDAHNLYDRGFRKESGLKMVAAGETHSGYVRYLVNRGEERDL